MEELIIYPTKKSDFEALKAFAKALKLNFVINKKEESYSHEFIAMIKQGDDDIKNGNLTTISINDLKNLCK